MKTPFAHFAGAVLLSALAPAQQTWIVDPAGTGHFNSLSAAVMAASAGDTLMLRGGGNYPGVTFDKPLSVVGVPPQRPQIGFLLMSQSIGSGHCSVSGVRVGSTWVTGNTSFEDVSFSGTVHVISGLASLHRCQIILPAGAGVGAFADSYGAVVDASGSAIFSECVIEGGPAFNYFQHPWGCQTMGGGIAVGVSGGSVVISDCTLKGADGAYGCAYPPVVSPQPALHSHLHTVPGRVRVSRSILLGGAVAPGTTGQGAASVIGSIEYDASVQFNPAYSAGSLEFIPTTGGQGATPGGTITCHAATAPNLAAVLVASLGMAGPTQLPQGTIWIDPSAFVVLRIGFTDAAGLMPATIPLPPSAPRGFPISVQSGAVPSPGLNIIPGLPVVLHVL